MKNYNRLFLATVFVLSFFAYSEAQTKKYKNQPRWDWRKHEAETIDYAKKYLVSNIEPNLPRQSFAVWFQKTIGKKAKMRWEINDCGEQSGTPADSGRDFPMCVEATAEEFDLFVSVNIQFGMFSRGITKMKPVVRSIVIDTEGEEGEWLEKLVDLPKRLKEIEGR